MLRGVKAASPSPQAFVPGPQEFGPQPDSTWCHMESSTCLGLFLPDPGGLPGAGRLPLLLITGWQRQFSSWHCPAGRQNPRASSGGRWSCTEHLLPMWPQPNSWGWSKTSARGDSAIWLLLQLPWHRKLLPSSIPSWKGAQVSVSHSGSCWEAGSTQPSHHEGQVFGCFGPAFLQKGWSERSPALLTASPPLPCQDRGWQQQQKRPPGPPPAFTTPQVCLVGLGSSHGFPVQVLQERHQVAEPGLAGRAQQPPHPQRLRAGKAAVHGEDSLQPRRRGLARPLPGRSVCIGGGGERGAEGYLKRRGPGEESWKREGEEDAMGWRRKDVSTAVLGDWRAAVGGWEEVVCPWSP